MSHAELIIGIDDLPKVPIVLDGVSSRFIRENRIIPLEMKNNQLKVLMADSGNREVIDALRVASLPKSRFTAGMGR